MALDNLLILNIINSGISLIMGLYMFFLQRYSFGLGTKYWAIGSLFVGVGLLFKILSPIVGSFLMIGSPILITIGLYLYLAGIWAFKEKRINKWIIIGIPVLDILQSIICVLIFHSYRIQVGIHLFFLILYCLLAIFEMIRLNSAQQYLRKIFFLNAFSFIVLLILLLINFYSLITNPDFNTSGINNAVLYLHLISGFLMIALTFGFLSAVNIRLNMELEGQIQSKTKFVSIIAHDLRGPVGNIANFLDLLQNEPDLNEKQRREYLKLINIVSQSTYHLLQNLLEWATKSKNLNKFESEKIELSQLISSNIDYFISSAVLKSINLEFKEGEQTYFLGNVNMIQTIVRNLVSNAIKYTPKGGTITITSEKVLNKVRLIVSDTGLGIKPEVINSLFQFETNRSTLGTNGEVGSGLGLSLCKELVSSNNGVMEIKSEEGIGTKVIVEFPSHNTL